MYLTILVSYLQVSRCSIILVSGECREGKRFLILTESTSSASYHQWRYWNVVFAVLLEAWRTITVLPPCDADVFCSQVHCALTWQRIPGCSARLSSVRGAAVCCAANGRTSSAQVWAPRRSRRFEGRKYAVLWPECWLAVSLRPEPAISRMPQSGPGLREIDVRPIGTCEFELCVRIKWVLKREG